MANYTEAKKIDQTHLHCPYCDKKFFTAASIFDMNYKCDKCHRRYLINVDDGSVSIKLISKPHDNDVE